MDEFISSLMAVCGVVSLIGLPIGFAMEGWYVFSGILAVVSLAFFVSVRDSFWQ